MKKYALYANNASYGGIHLIGDYIGDVFLGTKTVNNYDTYIKNKSYHPNTNLFYQYETLIIFGVISLKKLIKNGWNIKRQKNVTLIISDTTFLLETVKWNNYLKNNPKIKILIMPDEISFLDSSLTYKMYYQHIPHIKELQMKKTKEISFSHSPGAKYKSDKKGTSYIQSQIPDIRILSGLSWENCIRQKSCTTIFIDQMVDDTILNYKGGVGKSGLEAMLYGCLTITSGIIPFSICPVKCVEKERLKETVEYYMHNKGEREELCKIQQEWAMKNLSKNFVLNNILN
jgi:hypothetical protein